MAVLPTPGSPISTGLFFVRRERTWMTRRISSSRPMTGSSLPEAAASVRSLPNLVSASYFSSGLSSVTRCGPRTLATASATAPLVAPAVRRASPAGELWPARESRRCSVEMYSSCISRASCSAARRTAMKSGSVAGSATLDKRGLPGEGGVHVAAHGLGRRADALQDPGHQRVLLLEQDRQQVQRRHLRVLAGGGEGGGRLDGGLGLLGEAVESHASWVQISVGLTEIVGRRAPAGKAAGV